MRRSLSQWCDLLGLAVVAGCSPDVHLVSPPPTFGVCDLGGLVVSVVFLVVAVRGFARAAGDMRSTR